MNIFKLDFRSQTKGCLIWTGVIALVLLLFMSMFPSMQSAGMQDLVGTKLDALPPAMLAAFGLEDLPDFTQLIPFFAYTTQYIVMAAAIYAALLGATALIKEESDGTIEYLYAQPVTRTRIVGEKMLSGLATYSLFTFAVGLVSMIMAAVVKSEGTDLMAALTDIKLILGGMFFVGLIFMSVGFLASVLLTSAKQATAFSLGAVFITVILGVFAAVNDKLELLKYLSPIEGFKPSKLVTKGIDPAHVVIGLVVIIAASALSFFIYQRKDLKS